MAEKLKVLMSAYACEPGRGSEPGVGWRWAQQMTRFHDVTVVTRTNNQKCIEEALAGKTGPQPRFIYYDLPRWLVTSKHQWMPVALYYTLWQLTIRWKLRRRVKDFDLIHHATFNTFLLPGCWWFCGRPVVLGPLGGGQVFPWRFLPLLSTQIPLEILRTLRIVVDAINPYPYVRFYFANKILVANPDTVRRIPRVFRRKVVEMLETGVAADQLQEAKAPSDRSGIHLVSIGRLVRTKGLELALRAFALAWKQDNASRLTVIGNGPEEDRLHRLAASLGVADAVEWIGWLAHAEIRQTLARHDALIFTSLRDTSGNVLLEAMACGLPVITLAHQGAVAITTDETAIRVPVTTITRTIEGLAEAILSLMRSPELRARLGRAGRQRVGDLYSWDAKGDLMNDVYKSIFPSRYPRRLNVLLSAYACEPGRGSEPGVGWNWALQIARFHNVTVVTRANNRPSIDLFLATYEGPKPNFIYFALPSRVREWKRSWLSVRLFYVWWQMALRWHLRHRLDQFDLLHHITFNSYRWPGFWWFTRKPVILGPLGGGQICPWKFLRLFEAQSAEEASRSVDVSLSLLNPRHYIMFFFATSILVANQDTARRIPRIYRHKLRELLETGVFPTGQPQPNPSPQKSGRRFIWIGGLEKRKALPLALRALVLARQRDDSLQLTVVGTGPGAAEFKALAEKLGISTAVQWTGQVSHRKVAELLREHDALIFTSLRDTSGNVVLEAMLAGLPVITLLHQGAAEITTDETAIRVRPTTIRQAVSELADAICKLAHSPELRERLGNAGRARVAEQYLWSQKGEIIDVIYREAMEFHNGVGNRRTHSIGSGNGATVSGLSLADSDKRW
jgi:glycosyltransferase involved in cell wall biosynthesis